MTKVSKGEGFPKVLFAFLLLFTVLGSALTFLPSIGTAGAQVAAPSVDAVDGGSQPQALAANPASSTSGILSANSIGTVNIGYFANINHAPAILGISSGAFQTALGPSTTITSDGERVMKVTRSLKKGRSACSA